MSQRLVHCQFLCFFPFKSNNDHIQPFTILVSQVDTTQTNQTLLPKPNKFLASRCHFFFYFSKNVNCYQLCNTMCVIGIGAFFFFILSFQILFIYISHHRYHHFSQNQINFFPITNFFSSQLYFFFLIIITIIVIF